MEHWQVIALVWTTWTGMQNALPVSFTPFMSLEACELAIKDTETYRDLAIEYVLEVEENRLERGLVMVALRCHDTGVEL